MIVFNVLIVIENFLKMQLQGTLKYARKKMVHKVLKNDETIIYTLIYFYLLLCFVLIGAFLLFLQLSFSPSKLLVFFPHLFYLAIWAFYSSFLPELIWIYLSFIFSFYFLIFAFLSSAFPFPFFQILCFAFSHPSTSFRRI